MYTLTAQYTLRPGMDPNIINFEHVGDQLITFAEYEFVLTYVDDFGLPTTIPRTFYTYSNPEHIEQGLSDPRFVQINSKTIYILDDRAQITRGSGLDDLPKDLYVFDTETKQLSFVKTLNFPHYGIIAGSFDSSPFYIWTFFDGDSSYEIETLIDYQYADNIFSRANDIFNFNNYLLDLQPSLTTHGIDGIDVDALKAIQIYNSGDGNDVIDLPEISPTADTWWDFSKTFVAGNGNDVVRGSMINGETIEGGEGNDGLFGSGGRDTLRGGENDDDLGGGLDDDLIQGGEDVDTAKLIASDRDIAVYSGTVSDYTYTELTKGYLRVTDSRPNADGTDHLAEIQQLRLADAQIPALGHQVTDVDLTGLGLFLGTDVDPFIRDVVTQIIERADNTKWGSDADGVLTTITYSFARSQADFASDYFDQVSLSAPSQFAYQGALPTAVRAIFEQLEAIANLRFVEVDESVLDARGFAEVGTIRFGGFTQTDADELGAALRPSRADFSSPQFKGAAAGDIFLSTQFATSDFSQGTIAYGTLVHEIGHALGLGDFPWHSTPESPGPTVMAESGATGMGFQFADVLALQYLYGKVATPTPTFYLQPETATVYEGDQTVDVSVTLFANIPSSVPYEVTLSIVGGEDDFERVSTTVMIPALTTAVDVTFQLKGDYFSESDETFGVVATTPSWSGVQNTVGHIEIPNLSRDFEIIDDYLRFSPTDKIPKNPDMTGTTEAVRQAINTAFRGADKTTDTIFDVINSAEQIMRDDPLTYRWKDICYLNGMVAGFEGDRLSSVLQQVQAEFFDFFGVGYWGAGAVRSGYAAGDLLIDREEQLDFGASPQAAAADFLMI